MNVLLVEDERRVADFIRRGLTAEGCVVVVAHDGETALGQAAEGGFDAIVLDLMLPGIQGQEVCRLLRARGDATPILMLSALDRVDERISGLQIGADDYIVKPFDFEELLARLRSLVRRARGAIGGSGEAQELRAGSIRLDLRTLEAHSDGRSVALTATERGVLQVLLAARGGVVSRERLLNAVWGETADPLTNVVDVYVARLRRKLGQAGRSIETVRGSGYRLRPAAAEPEAASS